MHNASCFTKCKTVLQPLRILPNMQATQPADQERILKAINDSIGPIEMNQTLKRALVESSRFVAGTSRINIAQNSFVNCNVMHRSMTFCHAH